MSEKNVRTPRRKIYGTYVTGADGKRQLVGYTRHTNIRSAQSVALGENVVTEELGVDEIMHIARTGAEILGLEEDIDPNQTHFEGTDWRAELGRSDAPDPGEDE